MTRLLPNPFLSFLIAVSWCLLQRSLEPIQVLFGIALGIVVPKLFDFLSVAGANGFFRLGRALRLIAVVIYDIVVANFAVARLVLSLNRVPRPAWIEVPLLTKDHRVQAFLAAIITMTPGTVSVAFFQDHLRVHVLDCENVDEIVAAIQARYQMPLIEIFQRKEG